MDTGLPKAGLVGCYVAKAARKSPMAAHAVDVVSNSMAIRAGLACKSPLGPGKIIMNTMGDAAHAHLTY